KKQLPVLKEVKSKAIQNDPDKPTHILIEGDNYHALSVLNYTHQNAIDVIYIDPPYNTGARDWKYNNNFVDETDVYRHSKWLSFMKNRLQIAKYLLKPTGVLICAIDENEQERIGLLLEELFPSHEKTCVTIIHNPGGIQGDNFSYCHEYAYFIFPNDGTYIGKIHRDDADIIPFRDWGGKESKRETGRNSFYPIILKYNKIIGFGDVCDVDYHPESSNIKNPDGTISVYPIDNHQIERKWRFARQSVDQIKSDLFIENSNDEYVIKRRKSEYRYKTVWTDKKYNSNAYGSSLLNKMIDKKFPFPKSLYNVKECLDAVARNNPYAVILDYFAGSGTTAQAVLEMNRLDDGNRKFILCTNNEGNICEEICYPRVTNVINGYNAKAKTRTLLFDKKLSLRELSQTQTFLKEIEEIKTEQEKYFDRFESEFEDNTIKLFGVKNKNNDIAGLGGNLKYYKTAFVPAQPTDRNKEKLTKQSVEMLCLKENTFETVLETEVIKIFKNKDHYTGILFDEQKMHEFKELIKDFDLSVSVYIFSLGEDDFAEEFSEMQDKVKVCSIPAAILRVYKRIFR
ncbi:MAG: site-specific DNA-methyltransferase, partial [Nitrosopumilus sp.]